MRSCLTSLDKFRSLGEEYDAAFADVVALIARPEHSAPPNDDEYLVIDVMDVHWSGCAVGQMASERRQLPVGMAPVKEDVHLAAIQPLQPLDVGCLRDVWD